MASPQVEDGYVRVARELFAAMAKHPFSGSEFMVLLAVMGKTYGWNKLTDEISINQMVVLTGLTRRGVCKATSSLVNKMALGREQKGTSLVTTYWIEKDYDKWLGREQKGTSAKTGKKVVNKKALDLVNKKAPTIDTIKDILQNTSIAPTTLLQKFFYAEYQKSFDVPYHPSWAKDGAIFKDLLKTIPEDRLKFLIKSFFNNTDTFILNAGYTVGVFKSQINKLRLPGGSSTALLELQEMMKNDK